MRKRKRRPRKAVKLTAGRKGEAGPETRSRPKLPLWKKTLFGLVTTCVFFVALELLLRACGIRPLLATEDPFVGFESKIPLFVERRQADGTAILVTAENKVGVFNRQTFPKRKARDTYRIFCLGGSTTYGRPYDDTTSFCGWLRELLPVADPSQQWEVINAGGISYASYRAAVVMEELARCEPDLFVIYSGHNEFLERRTYQEILETPSWVTGAASQLGRTCTYTLVKRAFEAVGEEHARPQDGRYLLPGEVDEILDHSVGPSAYTRDDALRDRIIEHYRFNLCRMVDLGRSAGAEVVLVTPASNLRQCSPFKSEHVSGLSAAARKRWQALYDEARQLEESGGLADALTLLSQAEAIDDRHAKMLFRKGRILYSLGRYEEAKRTLKRARDEDVCPLRALTTMVDVVREVADERSVPLVDFEADIEQRSDHAIADEQHFLDHVHPTIAGNRLLALALVDTLADRGVVHPASSWNDAAVQAVVRSVEQRIDAKAHGEALLNLSKVLGWAGKSEEADRLVAKAAQTLGDNADVLFGLGLRAGRAGNTQEAEKYYRRALQVMPYHPKAHFKLGLLMESRDNFAEAALHYRQALRAKPDFVEASSNLAGVLLKQGQTQQGIAQYREALRLDPEHAQTHYNLGLWLAKQSKFDEAGVHLSQVVRIWPHHAEAHFNLAVIVAQQGKMAEAMAHCKEAIRIRPDHADAHYNLGALLARQGRLTEAATSLSEALRLQPDLAGVREKLELIEAALRESQPPPQEGQGSAAPE